MYKYFIHNSQTFNILLKLKHCITFSLSTPNDLEEQSTEISAKEMTRKIVKINENKKLY